MSASLNPLEPTLQAVESQIQELSGALVTGKVVQLEDCSHQLRNLAVEFVRVLESVRGAPISETMESRLRSVHTALGVVRESLARLSAVSDRQLAVLMPGNGIQDSTYVPRIGNAPGGAGSIYRAST